MTASSERIKELLGNGLSNEVVASAVGVDPSYVSQLMSDEVFRTEVVERRTKVLAAATSRDRTWDSAEDKVLAELHDKLDNKEFYKPMDLLRAAAVINMAQRRGSKVQETAQTPSQVVHLTLPTIVVHKFQQNSMGEIVEVDGQTLVSMPATTLMARLAEKNAGKKNDYEQVRKYLPEAGKVKDG